VNLSFSKSIYDKDGELIHAYLSDDEQWRMFIELNEITPELKKAIIEKEDKYFYSHPGVNPIAIVRALFNNIKEGRRTSGASTITMQVARMLNRKERTYWNKLVEMFNALQLELNYSKEEILQLYLNKVPYGGNIEGVKAASILYFQKQPDHLSLAECVALSVIPNDPVRLRPGKNNVAIVENRNEWLNYYLENEIFDKDDLESALNEPFEYKRNPAPRLAPHFSRRMRNDPRNNIRTHLDLKMQSHLEQMLLTYSNRLKVFDINNVSAIVIQNDSNKVVSYLGSADFHDNLNAGQVDGIRAIRSPGSTLKPYLYALAFDQGFLTPQSILNDVPTSFAQYEPENYDGDYKGAVSTHLALAQSLNVPAVKTLDRLGEEYFKDKLVAAQFDNIQRNRKHLGLSMILGGCGVSLEELVGMYASFARNGMYQDLNYTDYQMNQDSVQLISSSASFMLSEILMDVVRPDLPGEWQNTVDLPAVAWKTGTSYGRKDAWSVGYNKDYTVGVWVGNFSGKGVPELSGAQMASPIFFDIFNYITKHKDIHWHVPDDNLNYRSVCSVSGKVPGKYCADITDDLFLPGVSHYSECTHLQEILISSDSTLSYCSNCLPDAGFIRALYPNIDPEILNWKKSNKIKFRSVPTHNPDCDKFHTGTAPKIVHPVDGLEYFVSKGDSTELMLQAQSSNNVQKVYWYLNNRFVGSANANEKLYVFPPEGELKISCSDDKGRNSNIEIDVKMVNF